jgi:hypothetical protein
LKDISITIKPLRFSSTRMARRESKSSLLSIPMWTRRIELVVSWSIEDGYLGISRTLDTIEFKAVSFSMEFSTEVMLRPNTQRPIQL